MNIYIFLMASTLYSKFHFQSLTYDHVELNFFINGKAQNIPFTGIKGTVFPVLYGNLIKPQ